MTNQQLLKELDSLPEEKFQKFFSTLPSRVKLIVSSGMADWRKVLPQWYATYKKNR